MSKETIDTSEFLDIDYDARHFLYFNWKGYVSVEQVKEGCKRILKIAESKDCYTWLNDNRMLLGSWTQAIRWLAEEFFPAVVRTQNLKIAFIYSPQLSARYSVDKLLEVNDEYDAQTFEDYDMAEAWLLSKAHTLVREKTSSTGPSLSIRSGEGHRIFKVSDINYIAADGKSVLIHVDNELHSAKISLEELEKRFAGTALLRVHRSFILNTDKISTMAYHSGGAYKAFLKDHPRLSIPVSRSYAQIVKKKVGIDNS